ncbi:DUF3108 domain-containing protein [Sulfuricurvum sp.]|uniref:DUF3108 domain-containing protein n=1 Tax=Sulfuricurvum sp. TaxID=2025608 RepID=UPI002612D2C9|nr:DUF3108 domain-containing protein [Sulfuricurvum sp.]MDD2266176.1 DUF3108 domain-containing protein [Sulfuricurvum sp.]MDD2784413.1 DUF3108 domain-containing protein [Sulfuricurvum sp.]
MKKIVLLLLVLSQIAGAKVLTATYEVSFGVFQTMGIADARFETNDDDTYSIRIEARTTGIAKLLTNNRVETYESYGHIVNGVLIPQKYIKIRRTDLKKTIKIYTFDHPNKTVWVENIQSDQWDKVKNEFYASEDILTLFFNFKNYLKVREDRPFYVIGGNRKDGRIDVVFPNPKVLKEMQKEIETEDGDFMKVVLNDRIFSSANGELLINLSRDGLCNKAVLEDVLLFGDIVGVRVR